MKIQIKYILVLLTLVLVSCKEKKSANREEQSVKKNTADLYYSDDFYIMLKAKVVKEDEFQIFYKQNISESYMEDRSATIKISPNSEFQNVEFILPNDVYPYNLRLDLGMNSDQVSIQIKHITLGYKDQNFKIEAKDITRYFTLNEGVQILPDSTTFFLKTHKRENNIVYDPHLTGKAELNEIIYNEL